MVALNGRPHLFFPYACFGVIPSAILHNRYLSYHDDERHQTDQQQTPDVSKRP
jgi:hypothetical protein